MMAQRRKREKPISGAIVTQFTDTYVSVCHIVLEEKFPIRT